MADLFSLDGGPGTQILQGGSSILNALLNNQNFNAGIDTATQGVSAAKDNLTQQQQLEQQLMKLATAGVTDATGNTVGYDPTTGQWTTKLSPTGQALNSGTNQEILNSILHDAPLWRQGYDTNAMMRDKETLAGRGSLAKLQGPQPYSAAGMTGAMDRAGAAGLDTSYHNLYDPTVINAMRSGANLSNLGAQLQPLAAQSNRDWTQMMANNEVNGATTAQNLNNQFDQSNLSKFGAEASAGANIGQNPAQLSNIDQNLQNLITTRGSGVNTAGAAGASAANGAVQGLNGATGIATGAQQKPNNTTGGLGTDLGGLFGGVASLAGFL